MTSTGSTIFCSLAGKNCNFFLNGYFNAHDFTDFSSPFFSKPRTTICWSFSGNDCSCKSITSRITTATTVCTTQTVSYLLNLWININCKNLLEQSKQKTKCKGNCKTNGNSKKNNFHSQSPYLISPLKPRNARLSKPAATKRIGVPLNAFGTGAISSRLRIPAITRRLIKNPAALPKA